jgi:hypothetical protein
MSGIAMHSEALPKIFRPRALQTILVGGAIAGLLDGLDAVIFYWLAFAVPPATIFQGIASGLLGQQSFRDGWLTVVLGIALQFFIAIGAAAFYYAATFLIPMLWRKPWIGGPAFGIGLFYFMQHVVLPLSAVRKRTAPMSLGELVDQLLSHAFLIGLPIGLMARRSARNR